MHSLSMDKGNIFTMRRILKLDRLFTMGKNIDMLMRMFWVSAF